MRQGVFITGASGFLGRNLAGFLLKNKSKVFLCDVIRSKEIDQLESLGGEFLRQDFSALSVPARRKLKSCSSVVHLACVTTPATSEADPVSDINSNLARTAAFLSVCADAGVKKIVFASSGGTVYGRQYKLPVRETVFPEPCNMHGAMKLCTETYIKAFSRKYGFGCALMRISNLYGPLQNYNAPFGAVAVFASAIRNRRPVRIWGRGETTRDYIHINDVVAAFDIAIRSKAVEGVFNVSSGKGTSLNTLVRLIEKEAGLKADIRHLPPRNVDIPVSVLSPAKLSGISGWRPRIPLPEGIRTVLRSLE